MDYAQMSNGDINRAIAKRLGWTLKIKPSTPHQMTTGEIITFDIEYWYDTEGQHMFMGDWSTDLNAAWELLKQFPVTVEYPTITWTGEKAKFLHVMQLKPESSPALIHIQRESPARAICEAWLLWQDQH